MLNNGNIPDDIKNLINNLQNNSTNTSNNTSNNDNDNVNNSSLGNNSINPEMIKNILNMLNNSNNVNNNDNSNLDNNDSSSNIDINMLLKIKSIMDKMNSNKNDPRSKLLLSLKPYLKESRKNKVEQYVQLLNMSKIIESFGKDGGENIK